MEIYLGNMLNETETPFLLVQYEDGTVTWVESH